MHRGCCISCTCARTRDLPKVFPSFTHTHTHTHTGETHSFNAASGILSISRTTACVPNMLFPSYPSRCDLRASFAHSWRSLATRACVTRTNDSVYVANSPRVIVVTAEWNRFLQTHNETGGGGGILQSRFSIANQPLRKTYPPDSDHTVTETYCTGTATIATATTATHRPCERQVCVRSCP